MGKDFDYVPPYAQEEKPEKAGKQSNDKSATRSHDCRHGEFAPVEVAARKTESVKEAPRKVW